MLGSSLTLEMRFEEAWPVLEKAVKMAAKVGDKPAHVQGLTNLVLALLRGARPKDALKQAKKLYKLSKEPRTADVRLLER